MIFCDGATDRAAICVGQSTLFIACRRLEHAFAVLVNRVRRQ
jgi:hypothetical protein